MEMMDICLLKHVGVLGFLSVVVHLSKQHNVRDPEFGENKRSGCTCMYVHVHIIHVHTYMYDVYMYDVYMYIHTCTHHT